MVDRKSELDLFRKDICRRLAFHADVERLVRITDDQGGHPVVVALSVEPLTSLTERVRSVGGNANVFVLSEDSSIWRMSVVNAACAIPEPDDDMTASGETPHPDSTVGLFLEYVRRHPNGVLIPSGLGRSAKVSESQAVELVDA